MSAGFLFWHLREAADLVPSGDLRMLPTRDWRGNGPDTRRHHPHFRHRRHQHPHRHHRCHRQYRHDHHDHDDDDDEDHHGHQEHDYDAEYDDDVDDDDKLTNDCDAYEGDEGGLDVDRRDVNDNHAAVDDGVRGYDYREGDGDDGGDDGDVDVVDN